MREHSKCKGPGVQTCQEASEAARPVREGQSLLGSVGPTKDF